MISPYEVKDRQLNEDFGMSLERHIDDGLTYNRVTDSCNFTYVFQEISAEKMKLLTKYMNAGYEVTIEPRSYGDKTKLAASFSYRFNNGK